MTIHEIVSAYADVTALMSEQDSMAVGGFSEDEIKRIAKVIGTALFHSVGPSHDKEGNIADLGLAFVIGLLVAKQIARNPERGIPYA